MASTQDTGLSQADLSAMQGVFRQFPWLQEVRLYGSRAKGNFRPNSDVDLALIGPVPALQAQAVALALDELPMPYLFDVQAYADIRHAPLREHIDRVGLVLYRASEAGTAR